MKTLLSVMVVATATLVVPQGSVTLPPTSTSAAPASARGPMPAGFGVGERTEYRVKYGPATVGKGAIEVKSIGSVRSRPTWNVELRVAASVFALYSLTGVYSSWIDTSTLHSLQYTSEQIERGNKRLRAYDIFPERSVFRQRITPDTLPEMPSVPDPLDEASFLYFIRTIPLEVGQTYSFPRYFRPDRNPVVIHVTGKEDVSVPAGIFQAIVIRPTIRTPNGMFSQGAEAKVWVSDTPARVILRVSSKAGNFLTMNMEMTKHTPAKAPPRR